MPLIVAHRGFSARHPESTRASYREAIDWCEQTGVPINVEGDVHFSADGELVILHDLTIDRTSNGTGLVHELTVDQLRRYDFGCRRVALPTADEQALVTLPELLEMVRAARARGVHVGINIETKHPNSRGTQIEERVRDLLRDHGWTDADAPVRLISFALEGVEAMARLLPDVPRVLLVQDDLGHWSDGHLPPGCHAIGPGIRLVRADPGYVERVHDHGGEVHPWTLNQPADIILCRELGVGGYTTDDPERVATLLGLLPGRSSAEALAPAGARAG